MKHDEEAAKIAAQKPVLAWLILFVIFGTGSDLLYASYFRLPNPLNENDWAGSLLQGIVGGDLRYVGFIVYNTLLLILFGKIADSLIAKYSHHHHEKL